MSTYAGYGFDVRNISEENLFRFFMKYDSADRIEEMITETLGVSKSPGQLTEDDTKKLVGAIREYIESGCETVADYVADTINYSEREARHMHQQDVVTVCDEYVVFPPVMFPNDGKERLKRIRNRKDFVSMIRDYIPDKDLVFGPVYDGPEFANHDYWMGTPDKQ